MRKIIYYVATSIDGYIAGENNDVSQFIHQGKSIETYQMDLSLFKTVIMGRKTYEFGYQFGLTPGQPAYPSMDHYIFSNSIHFTNAHPQVHLKEANLDIIDHIKETSSTDIYLCGGGDFAGWLLNHQLIDEIKIKLNPIILGGGIKLFGKSNSNYALQLIQQNSFEDGIQILTYAINYSNEPTQ